MNALSSTFNLVSKEAISDYRFIQPVIRLARKIQTFVADIFYTFCYFAFPSMRSRPYEIGGRHQQLQEYGSEEFPQADFSNGLIFCGNQTFERRAGKFINGEEIERWFEKTVTYANRARPYTIERFYFQNGKTQNTWLGDVFFQNRGKTPKIWKEEGEK